MKHHRNELHRYGHKCYDLDCHIDPSKLLRGVKVFSFVTGRFRLKGQMWPKRQNVLFAACRAKRHFVLVGLAYVAFAYSHRVVVGSVDGTVVGCWSAVFMAAGGLFFLVG